MDPEVRFKEWFEKYVEEGGTLRPPSQTLMATAFRAGWDWRKSVEIDVADHYRTRGFPRQDPVSDPWCLDHGQPAATCTDCRAALEEAEHNRRVLDDLEPPTIKVEVGLDVVKLHLNYVLKLIADQTATRGNVMDVGIADTELFDLRDFLADLSPDLSRNGTLDVGSATRTPLPEPRPNIGQDGYHPLSPDVAAEYNKRLREHMEVNRISADEMLTVIAEILVSASTEGEMEELMSHLDRKQLTLEEKLALLNKNFTDAERYQLAIEWMREKGHIGEFADVMDEQGRI
jgi:hypothetical protein